MTSSPHPRLRFVYARPPSEASQTDTDLLAGVVAEGLSRPDKQLPCRFFYDAAGSALFERICELPEYYLTRTELSILERHAGEMVEASTAGRKLRIVELGSGSSRKTRLLLAAALKRQPALHYVPIDISAEFLRDSACALLHEHDRLTVTAMAGEYRDGLAALPRHDGPTLTLFLGSNVGNFEEDEAVELLRSVRERMTSGDRALVGIDLVKDRKVLLAAYNDAAGVTAAFNKNLLVRINRQLGGTFDLDSFDHQAPLVDERSRIEMRLVSRVPQAVRVDALKRSFTFRQGESIHTENSHKYTLGGFAAVCRRAGLDLREQWLDSRDWFAVVLLGPNAPQSAHNGRTS